MLCVKADGAVDEDCKWKTVDYILLFQKLFVK